MSNKKLSEITFTVHGDDIFRSSVFKLIDIVASNISKPLINNIISTMGSMKIRYISIRSLCHLDDTNDGVMNATISKNEILLSEQFNISEKNACILIRALFQIIRIRLSPNNFKWNPITFMKNADLRYKEELMGYYVECHALNMYLTFTDEFWDFANKVIQKKMCLTHKEASSTSSNKDELYKNMVMSLTTLKGM